MASRPEDFIVAVEVNQDGVDTYTRALEGVAVDVTRIAHQINAIRLPGIRFRADAVNLRRRIRNEAQQRARDKARTASSMARLAAGLQRAAVKETERSLVRKSAASGALAALTASARNQVATNTFFGVGNIPVLLADRKVRYALAIEDGSSASVGRFLTGVWVGGRGGAYGFGAPSPNQVFRPMPADEARALLQRSHRRMVIRGRITRPITAHRAYDAAIRSFQPQQKMHDELRRIYGF